jgi:CheY-like chemotaxis protein
MNRSDSGGTGDFSAPPIEAQILARLAVGLAHDFADLLTIINTQTHWMLDHLGNADSLRRALREIVRAGERASELNRRFLAFSGPPAEPKLLDLNRVVERLRLVLPRVFGAGVVLDVNASAPDPCLLADQGQLERLVLCLAAAAGDFVPPGGVLEISTSNVELDQQAVHGRSGWQPGSYLSLSVSLPPGFPDGGPFSVPAFLFDIAAVAGGLFDLKTEDGCPTAFRVYWQTPARIHAATDIRILVVDDVPAVRTWIREILKSVDRPTIVHEAADGLEAIRMVRAGGVDVVITDLIMPNQEGIETIQIIRREFPDVRIIAISGALQSEYLQMARALGADATLRKPFTPEALLRAVSTLLRCDG